MSNNIKLSIRENAEENALMQSMIVNMDSQDDAQLGSFWYDTEKDELFGVSKTFAQDCKFYNSPQFKTSIRTGRALHSAVWKKEYMKGRDARFRGDYTKVPRGRVFEFKDEGFRVYTDSWIDGYPEVKAQIIFEFQLPEDKTTFHKDIHWEIGHGWSDEMI